MDSVIRGVVVYLFLLLVFRLSGKRTLAQTSPFELILLLIISETTQQAMVDQDHSVTNAFLLIVTLTSMSLLMSRIQQRWPATSGWLQGLPLQVVADGVPLRDRMRRARVGEAEILAAARSVHGLEHFGQIRHAVIEADGTISIVPREPGH